MSQLSSQLSLPLMYIHEPQSHLTSLCQCPIIHVVAQTNHHRWERGDERISLRLFLRANCMLFLRWDNKSCDWEVGGWSYSDNNDRPNELCTFTDQISLNEKLLLSAASNDTVTSLWYCCKESSRFHSSFKSLVLVVTFPSCFISRVLNERWWTL